MGTWEFDALAWESFTDLAIGFKFGTGNNPNEWFVFSVAEDFFEGTWLFVNCCAQGGGLSHVNLYGIEGQDVPEPGTLALFGAGLILIALRRRRRPI